MYAVMVNVKGLGEFRFGDIVPLFSDAEEIAIDQMLYREDYLRLFPVRKLFIYDLNSGTVRRDFTHELKNRKADLIYFHNLTKPGMERKR